MTSQTAQLDALTPPGPGSAAGLESDLDRPSAPLLLVGELDADATERLRALLDDRTTSGHRLEVDLSGVTHLSAAALAVLVSAHRKLRDRRGVLVLCAPSLAVRKVLRVSGLHRVFEIAPE